MTTADCPPEQLTTDQAKARILEQLSPVRSVEPVRLQEALGRVLASDLIAPIDVPGFANSAMDGYALHRSDIKTAGQQGLTLAGYSTAGHPFNDRLKPGNCIRIMTGALLPEGADTVVMQEQTRIEQELVFTTSEVQPGDNVRNAGEDLRQDTQVLSAGHLLTSADLGLIASLGISQIDVVRRLSVAYFSTGDELVTADQTLA
ncbi:MAG TPA: molybdopterin molybdenumtransferase MoeA, partial [Gammaproteobacteria bacterium]|nr:molybdopterin molybdenumtransferase MoeA [Gammaproteobacteria bacterium]